MVEHRRALAIPLIAIAHLACWMGWGVMQASCDCAGRGQPQVRLIARGGHEAVVQVEVASDPQDRARGLMFRRQLGAESGMLFVFPGEMNQSFWMKNTYLSLDLIFIGENRRIVGILPGAKPQSTESLSVGIPSLYVLEVNAGFARRHGLAVGDKVELSGIPGL